MDLEAFSNYVSPNLFQFLIKNPKELKLGGERRECTFVFTDLQGFTTLTERSEPTTIVSLLNEYIDKMTKIAFKYDGTIDKIIGDGMSIVFSAPVFQENHAFKGVNCAIEISEFAEEFSIRKQSEGIEVRHTRIGVNTGNVIIGNVGGSIRFDYTAIGDAVNVTYNKAFDLLNNNDPAAKGTFKTLRNEYPKDPLIKFHFQRLLSGETGSEIRLQIK